MEKSLTLGNEEMRTVLKEKRFQTYYEQVMHYLKEMKNRKTSEEGLEYFFSESLKKLDFLKIQKRMELIEEDCWHVDIILCRKLVMEDGTEKMAGKSGSIIKSCFLIIKWIIRRKSKVIGMPE